jgi:tetratricopeptide (TPR) repeat protein
VDQAERERLRRANQLFESVLAQPSEARESWLRSACAGDLQLFELVQRLLQISASERDPTLIREGLEAPAALLAEVMLDGPAKTGDRIGNYQLLDELGHGGMAVVWRAKRADGTFEAEVACKMLKQELHGAAGLARFDRERQILARIRHPHIASLLDAGVLANGVPYFVMELITGKPVDLYARELRLSLEQRLGLFRQVCQAVEFAHQNLVIHRDLKPSNILVDSAGMVKLLDFGIAKALDQDAESEQTRAEQRFLTPSWASPEQLSGRSVTTASDQFQLGRLLHLLVTDQGPRDGDSSQRPSLVVSRAAAESIESAFGSTRAKLARELKGDLDAIVMRALEHNPEHRYPSVSSLIEDLDRYLASQAILARPSTAAYRLGKLLRRNRAAAGLVGLLMLVLLGFSITMAVQASRLAAARDQARREAEIGRQIAQFLKEVFQVADPNEARGNQVTAREILDKASKRLDERMPQTSAVKAELQTTIGDVYRSLGLYREAQPFYAGALTSYRQLGGEESDPALRAEARVAVLYREVGRLDEAQAILERVVPELRRRWGTENPETLNSTHNLAAVYQDRQEIEKALPLLQEVHVMRQRVLGTDHIDTLRSQINLAVNLRRSGKADEAEPLLTQAVEILTRTEGADDPTTLAGRINLAGVYSAQLRNAEAARAYAELLVDADRVLGPDSLISQVAVQNLATIAETTGDHQRAEQMYRRSLTSFSKSLLPEHPQVLNAKHNLGMFLVSRRKHLAEAEQLLTEALSTAQRVQGEKAPLVSRTHFGLAALAAVKGDRETALSELERAAAEGFGEADLLYLVEPILARDARYAALAAKIKAQSE